MVLPIPTAGDFEEKVFLLGTVFKPTAPIDRESLFAGRQVQTREIVDAINQQGQHAVLYGERGVGKTSLANMIFTKLHAPGSQVIAPQVNCMTMDNYSEIWKRVFEEILFRSSSPNGPTLSKPVKRLLKDYTDSYADQITPDIVRRVLHYLGQAAVVVIILDEFDTLESDGSRAMMSDTLKFLSDRSVPATVVLVGVAEDVESIIANHRSLERCLRQIALPRMSEDELEEIVSGGLHKVGMTIESAAIREISRISRGLPPYPHLLGLHAGRAALDRRTVRVGEVHIQIAIDEAIKNAQGSVKSDYSKAISSSRKDALYKEVLLACALAETDELGWFYPRDVRKPLEMILKRTYKIEGFARHLHAFCTDNHGTVLKNDNRSARPRFRFDDPLLQPYVLIRGLAQKLISPSTIDDLKEIRNPTQATLFD